MRTALIALGCALLVGCSGGGGEDPVSTVTPPSRSPVVPPPVVPPPVVHATLFWLAGNSFNGFINALLRGNTDGRDPVMLTDRLQRNGGLLEDLGVHPNDDAGVYYKADDTWWAAGYDGTAPRNIGPAHPFIPAVEPELSYLAQVAKRAVFSHENHRDLVSFNLNGTDRRHIASAEQGSTIWAFFAGADEQVLFNVGDGERKGLRGVSVYGGEVVTLADGPPYDTFIAVVGQRVVYYAACVAGFCDVYSVRNDGTGTIALFTHPDNDSVQGVIGQQVLVRRSRNGPTDTLVSMAVDGTGTETVITTLSYWNDFVVAIVGDRIILRRGQTMTSMFADGTGEVTLMPDEDMAYAGSAGSFLILQGPLSRPLPDVDLWSVPIDGSRPAQPVAVTEETELFVIGGLP